MTPEAQAALVVRMREAFQQYAKLYWPHNAGVTDNIETLRRACLECREWWNNIALPLLEDESCFVSGENHEGCMSLACETGDGA